MSKPQDFANIRALCVGDLIIDRFIDGSVTRISPESPVPVILVNKEMTVPGGSGNVARNISALGGYCSLFGAIGDDKGGSDLINLLVASGNIHVVPAVDRSRPTCEKIRYVAQGQQLLRADSEETHSIPQSVEDDICLSALEAMKQHDVLIISDYAKGTITDTLLTRLITAARQMGLPVIVDPKSADLARYAGASAITPNISEARAATGMEIKSDADAEQAGMKMLEDAQVDAILLTRSERGMSLIRRDHPPVHIPTSAREVYDVSGAGDTVVATLAMAIGAGVEMAEAAAMANLAAGLVVGKRGTATISISELQEERDRAAQKNLLIPTGKVKTQNSARIEREDWEARELRVGFTNGCFDILHLGHVKLLEFARSKCDRLIVAINSDASVSRLKGPTRPVNSEVDRAQILAALGFVDLVVVFDADTPKELIEALQPDVLVKGADYKVEDIIGADVVHARGGEVVTFELLPDRSTTQTIDRARNAESATAPAAT